MKIPLHTIDEFTDDIESLNIDPWFQDKMIVAKENNVSITDVEFKWHSCIGETVIFIKGNYSGYASDIWDCFVG